MLPVYHRCQALDLKLHFILKYRGLGGGGGGGGHFRNEAYGRIPSHQMSSIFHQTYLGHAAQLLIS